MSVILKTGASLFRSYNNLLITHPMKTKMVSSGIFASFGDIFCQTVIEKKTWEEYRFTRTLRQWSVGFFFMAPVAHFWFGKILPTLTASLKNPAVRVAGSVFLDNTIYGGSMLISGVFMLEFLKSWDLEASVENLKKKFRPMYGNAIKFWGTVSVINHIFMPQLYRPVFTNACGAIWQIYLSYMTNNKMPNIEEIAEIPAAAAGIVMQK